MPADSLCEAVWGDDPPARARNTLQVYVSTLRRALGDPGLIGWAGGAYTLRADRAEVDALAFADLVEQAQSRAQTGSWHEVATTAARAVALWTGHPLQEEGGGPWSAPVEQRYGELWLMARRLRAEALVALGRHGAAIADLQGLVAEHPTDERIAELLVLALYRSGRQAEALEALRVTRQRLADDLGVDASAAMQRLERAVLVQDPDLDPPMDPMASALPLPEPATRLIDRAEELAAVAPLLSGRQRLVTLTGPGGVGKTRLAIACARAAAEEFPDGVGWVPLDSLEDPLDVLPRIASQVGAPAGADPITQRLYRHLADRRMLLVMDNLEHLPSAWADVADLLAAAPLLHVLVTSRVPLRIEGEHVIRLAPLAVPEAGGDAAAVQASAAGCLFVERAAALDHRFELTDDVAPVVAEVCRRLDGLPLALELAAVGVARLGMDGVAQGLTASMELLSGGRADAPVRHRSMQAALDWHLRLLSDHEQQLLAELSVFAGGWMLDAARAVVLEVPDVQTTIAELVDQGLVRRHEHDGRSRFTMLQTVQEHARGVLHASGQLETAARRHAEHYLAWFGAEDGEWGQDAWTAELDNATAALRWAVDSDPVMAAQLCVALEPVWRASMAPTQGRRWADAVLALNAPMPDLLRADLLRTAGVLALWTADTDAGRTYLLEAVAMQQAAGALGDAVRTLGTLGVALLCQGEIGEAEQISRMAQAAAERAPESAWRSQALAAYVANEQRRHLDARAHYEAWLADAVGRRDGQGAERARAGLAVTSLLEGDAATAVELAEMLAARAAAGGSRHLVHAMTVCRCWCRLGAERYTEALDDAVTVLRGGVEMDNAYDVATGLLCVAAVAAARGAAEEAAVLSGAAHSLDAAYRNVRPIEEQSVCTPLIAAAEAQLGVAAFNRAARAGAYLPVEEAIVRAERVAEAALQRS